ncbi:aminotransferase [Kiloniella litopenaei]|uniref:Aminotransferase n=1 Tax=Kiloniella litopenaei TaxID=1549748 RepID=A0A0M2RFP9_9PROT|nr:aspartate aminotransferase family protein [Kiloniella litopenaei]KKJ78388.1 aminotransferase [Kiloniella litopenaei]
MSDSPKSASSGVPNSMAGRDVAYCLHPYTNARAHEEKGPLIITHGKGINVFDDQGKSYIEAMAGLWSTSLGFGEDRLIKAANKQMKELPYYHSFTHKTPIPPIELSEKLLSMAPVPMSKVFFANSGSEANDTVVKLVWYYNNAIGRPNKKKIISRMKGYHGVTVASASMTGLPANHTDFDLPIANILHTSCPHYWRFGKDGESEEDFSTRMANDLEKMILDEGPETIAAFIGEPVMGAGGVIVPPKDYWEKIQIVLKKYDILLIADEVICGFGRTGNTFGCETFGMKPDIISVAKALSSSYLPISAVMISDELYQGIADNSAKIGVLGHGYTYSGHPVCAAVALETLKIYEERNLFDQAAKVGEHLQAGLAQFKDHPLVGEVRGVGLIAAVELVQDKKTKASFDPVGKVGTYLNERAIEEGLIIRNMGDSIAFCPPLIITEDQIDQMLDRFKTALDKTLDWVKAEGLI